MSKALFLVHIVNAHSIPVLDFMLDETDDNSANSISLERKEKMAHFFLTAGIPFHHTEHKELLSAIQDLCPKVKKLTNRNTLAGPYLEQQFLSSTQLKSD
jgi:hypothetical protein